MSLQIALIAAIGVCTAAGAFAQSSDGNDLSADPSPEIRPAASADRIVPVITMPKPVSKDESGVDWNALLRESAAFLSLEHGFRYWTEEGTRHSHLPFFQGYVNSLNGLHGWADGDPFIVNYVGHPMQGAVSGFLFAQNDRKYRYVEFGRNRWYWRSRLRAAAYAWAYSEQFEIGLISEASIGHTQAFFPQQGFVDHVATPTIGLAWMIVEDALDKYVIRHVDERTHSGVIKMLVRGGLNPSRSMANAMSFDTPWHRNDRIDPWEPPRLSLMKITPKPVHGEGEIYPLAAPFELTVNTRMLQAVGPGARGSCIGGGAMAAFRVSPTWQIAGDVGGCKMTHFAENYSGDSLTYMLGPRWTPSADKQWEPFAQLLVGGRTLTHEKMNPEEKAALEEVARKEGKPLSFPDHDRYTTDTEVTGMAVAASAGVDVKLNSAIAFRVVDLGYMHSWHSRLDGVNYGNTVQLTAGMTLRFGTW